MNYETATLTVNSSIFILIPQLQIFTRKNQAKPVSNFMFFRK